jgi:hypothetical protein
MIFFAIGESFRRVAGLHMYNGQEMEHQRMLKKILIGSAFGLLLSVGTVCAEVVVRVAPPAPIVETRIARPGPNHVWIAGYHRWDGNAYVWVPGRWEIPPRPGARWVAHRWVKRHGGWVLVEGHWR